MVALLRYIIVKGMFSPEEVSKIRGCIEGSELVNANAYGREDDQGREGRLCMWNYAGDDIVGVVARSVSIGLTFLTDS